jgi:hypothetical protein
MKTKTRKTIATFYIVAFDPETDSIGVAVQSKFLAVGSVVPWAQAGVGAVATQAMANYNYGPRGLDLISEGNTAEQTVEVLTSADDDREHRQVGVVDAQGRAATFTGSECFAWAGASRGSTTRPRATSSSAKRRSRRWQGLTRRLTATSRRACSRRSTPGRRWVGSCGESNRRRCSSCGRVGVTAGTTTG